MALVPIEPAKISVRPALLHEHASRVADATDVARTFSARHVGYLSNCAAAWAGTSAQALAEVSAHWEGSDTRLHGRVSAFSEAMGEGGRHYAAMEEEHVLMFSALGVPAEPGASSG